MRGTGGVDMVLVELRDVDEPARRLYRAMYTHKGYQTLDNKGMKE
jgi:hypothetical protein